MYMKKIILTHKGPLQVINLCAKAFAFGHVSFHTERERERDEIYMNV